MKMPVHHFLTVILILLLAGCGEDQSAQIAAVEETAPESTNVESVVSPSLAEPIVVEEPSPENDSRPKTVGQADSVLTLAHVKQSTITESELISEANRLFGDVSYGTLSNDVKRNLLESLVVRRRVSQKQLALLSDAEKKALELDTAAYKEKLLLKKYLQQFATPAAVSDETVLDYYLSHPEEFGGGDKRHYQIVFQKEVATGDQQSIEIELVGALKTEPDFDLSARTLVSDTPNLVLKKGALERKTFPGAISDQMSSLEVGERRFMLHNSKPYLLYLEKVESIDPLPLLQVAAKIRRKLMGTQVKDKMTTIKNQVLGDPEVRLEQDAKDWGAGSDAAQ